jgi:DNA-3-methyladenine glycosylase II
VIARLVALRGIGRWSAEWILARALGRPCVVAGDLAVRKVVARAYLGYTSGVTLPDEAAIRHATAHWGAAASIAQGLLLHGYGADAT